MKDKACRVYLEKFDCGIIKSWRFNSVAAARSFVAKQIKGMKSVSWSEACALYPGTYAVNYLITGKNVSDVIDETYYMV